MKILATFLLSFVTFAPAQELRTATTHPMQYYLSLPQGWTAARKWPVLVAIESANREFQTNAEVFTKARGAAPFLIVVPFVVTNGGTRGRTSPPYRYSPQQWTGIERTGDFAFDFAGLAAILADLHKQYAAEDRYFVTGWEAGGHTVWALTFQHPEALRASIPVTSNYQGRGMTPANFSTHPSRADLPVHILEAGKGPAPWPNPFLAQQVSEARKQATAHGFSNITSAVAAGKEHGPLAEEVIAFCAKILNQRP